MTGTSQHTSNDLFDEKIPKQKWKKSKTHEFKHKKKHNLHKQSKTFSHYIKSDHLNKHTLHDLIHKEGDFLTKFAPLKNYYGTAKAVPREIQGQPLPINELKGKPPMEVCPALNLHRFKVTQRDVNSNLNPYKNELFKKNKYLRKLDSFGNFEYNDQEKTNIHININIAQTDNNENKNENKNDYKNENKNENDNQINPNKNNGCCKCITSLLSRLFPFFLCLVLL